MEKTPREKLVDIKKKLEDSDKYESYVNILNIILNKSTTISEKEFHTIGMFIHDVFKVKTELLQKQLKVLKILKKYKADNKELIKEILEVFEKT